MGCAIAAHARAGRAPQTHEALLHELGSADPVLLVFPTARDSGWLSARRGHRAIGVVYDTRQERYGNWIDGDGRPLRRVDPRRLHRSSPTAAIGPPRGSRREG